MACHVFILAGGAGKRLWPLSTPERPKPFVSLFEGKTLLRQTYERLDGVADPERIYVVTTANYKPLVRESLPDLAESQILCEPLPCNTATAVAWACGQILHRDPKGVVAFIPADQLIRNVQPFRRALTSAISSAERHDAILTLGISPTSPSPEYGYIACGEQVPASESDGALFQVEKFVEKPDVATAEKYLKSGRFLWNAGIFVAQVGVFAEAFRRHAPQWCSLLENPQDAPSLYPALPRLSIDVALIEHCERLLVVRGQFDWSDVGTLKAALECLPADACGNRSNTSILQQGSTECAVLSTMPERKVILFGTQGLAVVQTSDATFICPREALGDLNAWLASRGE